MAGEGRSSAGAGRHASAGERAIAAAFDRLPAAHLVFDASLTLIGSNRAARGILGLDLGTAAGGDLDTALTGAVHLTQDERAEIAGQIRTLLTGKATDAGLVRVQSRVLQITACAHDGGWTVTLVPSASEDAERCRTEDLDTLTGLLNRAAFRECLSDAEIEMQMKGRAAVLLCLDLDRFKQINDTLGHAVGDAILKRVAERLRKAVRAGDVLGRLGGDEFAILSPNVEPEAVEALAARLIDLVSRPYLVDGHLVNLGMSIGAAVMPHDAATGDHLAKCAELAVCRAKADGRGLLRRYHADVSLNAEYRRLLEFDLRKAQLLGEFELNYQPQMDIGGTDLVGFEALLRWNHPVRGRVSPADFVPLAEETGLIIPIGEWVLRTAVAEAVRWPEHVTIAVNLSPVQFRTGRLTAMVASVLAQSGLAPQRLELEITEGIMLDDAAANVATLRALQDLGVKVAIDDFGTGYASLAYLKRFSFDKIKIDQSFVREMCTSPSSDAIVRTVIELGRMLGMATLAEGVETVEELERIRAHGCGAVQGYLTGRPLKIDDVTLLLADQAGNRRECA